MALPDWVTLLFLSLWLLLAMLYVKGHNLIQEEKRKAEEERAKKEEFSNWTSSMIQRWNDDSKSK